MDTQVKIAILASITSALVAGLSLIMSILTNRHSSHSTKEIERLKFKFSRIIAKESIYDANLAESIKASQVAIQLIQKIKNDIQLILSAIEDSLDPKLAIERIESTREKIFTGFEEQLAALDKQEEVLFHEAKDITLGVEHFVKMSLNGKPRASCLSDEARQQLISFRSQLTDIQHLLRDSRADKIIRRLENE